MKYTFSVLFALFLFTGARDGRAQSTEGPLYEVRANWVTTVYRLDWPPYDAGVSPSKLRRAQKLTLRRILDDTKSRGQNTIMFQVFSHGGTVYPSEILPWAPWMNGAWGSDPGWDPLAYVLSQAHARGMEVHAWFNTFQMGNSNNKPSEENAPKHALYAHPEWVETVDAGGGAQQYWINPAYPEARDWVIGIVQELVRNYDLDAMHFDYMRYPSGGFDDDNVTKGDYPNGAASLFDWRRENVNIFARDVYNSIKAIKPWVKVGSAPIGAYRNYRGAPPGFYAYDAAYQEAYQWLEDGAQDYVAPQLYFSTSGGSSSPDFDHWLQEWTAHANGRHVYIGLATYKEARTNFESGEIARQVSRTREQGAEGQVQFRYSFMDQVSLRNRYKYPALIPDMPWIFVGKAPTTPGDPALTWNDETSTVTVRWKPSEAGENDPLRRYAVFRQEGSAPGATQPENLAAVLGPQDTTYTETFGEPTEAPVYYRIVAQSQIGKVSAPTEPVSSDAMTPVEPLPGGSSGLELRPNRPNPFRQSTRITFRLAEAAHAILTVYDVRGRQVATLVDRRLSAGTELTATFEAENLPAGVYFYRLQAGRRQRTGKMVLAAQ